MSDDLSVTQKVFKKLVRPFYNLLSQKLVGDLKVQETQELLLQINHRVFTVQNELEKLKAIQAASNLILSGQDTFENPLYQNYKEAALEVFDLAEAIRAKKQDPAEIVGFFDKAGVDVKGKNVTILGGGDNLYAHAAARKGAKSVFRIEGASHLSDSKSHNTTQFVYPLDLTKIKHQQTDILFIPSANWSTLLLSRNLAGFGSFVKNAIILSARVTQNTVFSSDAEPCLFDYNGRISFNDNFVRQQLHRNGFVEVVCAYTEGVRINNTFDIKMSRFNQLNGFNIFRRNSKYTKDPKYNNHQVSEKIYIGYKLPSKKHIS